MRLKTKKRRKISKLPETSNHLKPETLLDEVDQRRSTAPIEFPSMNLNQERSKRSKQRALRSPSHVNRKKTGHFLKKMKQMSMRPKNIEKRSSKTTLERTEHYKQYCIQFTGNFSRETIFRQIDELEEKLRQKYGVLKRIPLPQDSKTPNGKFFVSNLFLNPFAGVFLRVNVGTRDDMRGHTRTNTGLTIV